MPSFVSPHPDDYKQSPSIDEIAPMFDSLRSTFAKREIYFHEDDHCQQELLPREALAFVETQIKKIGEFAAAHRAPDGTGWTDMYLRPQPPATFRTFAMTKNDFDALISPHLPPFDLVYTGYSSYRERCRNTAAWGTSPHNAIFVDWDDEGIICNIWTQFFESDEKSLLAASKAVAALGTLHSLIYVDWAWGYACEVTNEEAFASRLRDKLEDIRESTKIPEGRPNA
jgi:hypothetical protein